MILGQLTEYYIEKISMEKFGRPNTNFGALHWLRSSLAYLILITVRNLIWFKDHWEPWNEVKSRSLANYIYISRVRTKKLLILSWGSGLWSRRWILETLWKWNLLQEVNLQSKFVFVFEPNLKKRQESLLRLPNMFLIFFSSGPSPDHFWSFNSKRF